MPTTMKLIAKQTLGSTAATVSFSSIPSTYTDLCVQISARTTPTTSYVFDYLVIGFNDSFADYSMRSLEGDGASGTGAFSLTRADYGVNFVGRIVGNNATANTFSNTEIYIPNYAGSTNKSLSATSVTETNGATAYIGAVAGLWSQTAAINKLTFDAEVDSFGIGSSFYLYGITRA